MPGLKHLLWDRRPTDFSLGPEFKFYTHGSMTTVQQLQFESSFADIRKTAVAQKIGQPEHMAHSFLRISVTLPLLSRPFSFFKNASVQQRACFLSREHFCDCDSRRTHTRAVVCCATATHTQYALAGPVLPQSTLTRAHTL